MKYKGIVELSIRKYLGTYIDKTMWQHVGYALGIKKNDEVYDYKTLQKYNFIDRNTQGVLNVYEDDLIEGQIYAIGGTGMLFDPNKKYSKRLIDKGINESNLYSDEYKKMKIKKR